jgi:hypothetical protein
LIKIPDFSSLTRKTFNLEMQGKSAFEVVLAEKEDGVGRGAA